MSYSPKLKRTSMSLDPGTLENLAELASRWGVSKSEVIRRAVRKTKADSDADLSKPSPLEALRWLRENGVSAEQADFIREEVEKERNSTQYWWE
ncbi:MAG: ribbon-helix-helix protein, CopG family [Luteolibacter sp.]